MQNPLAQTVSFPADRLPDPRENALTRAESSPKDFLDLTVEFKEDAEDRWSKIFQLLEESNDN